MPQAVGKLFSGRPGNAEGMVQTLGKIWCPSKGIRCKDLGDNLFLFSFLQPGGKKRAVSEGPWEFGGDLLIVVDLDGSKRLRDLEFIYTPVWIRVFDLPLGMMNEETGKVIGDKVGKALEVETDPDGSAMGSYLRVKVRLDIRKPLLRAVFLEGEGERAGEWCPIQYEFLPNFCYGCGLLGHVYRECDVSIGDGENQQYGDWMRASPLRKRNSVDSRSRGSGGGGSGASLQLQISGQGSRESGKEQIKQNISYHKDSSNGTDVHENGTNSLTKHKEKGGTGASQELSCGEKILLTKGSCQEVLEKNNNEGVGVVEGGMQNFCAGKSEDAGGMSSFVVEKADEQIAHAQLEDGGEGEGRGMEVDEAPQMTVDMQEEQVCISKKKTFKRVPRTKDFVCVTQVPLEKKRRLEEKGVQLEEEQKKRKMELGEDGDSVSNAYFEEAGLADQPCRAK